jgi:hypothetical protein
MHFASSYTITCRIVDGMIAWVCAVDTVVENAIVK